MGSSWTVVNKVLVPVCMKLQKLAGCACAKELVKSRAERVHSVVGHAYNLSANAWGTRVFELKFWGNPCVKGGEMERADWYQVFIVC